MSFSEKLEKDNVYFYSSDLIESTFKRWSLENELREALEINGFILLYQPKVCTKLKE